MLTGFDKFESGTNFKAWFSKYWPILLSTNIAKGERTTKGRIWKIEYATAEPETRKNLQDQIVENDKAYEEVFDDEIIAALDKLSDDFKIVVLLCDVHHFPYKEIATMIDKPIGTVMSRLSRGRKQLQKYLEEYAQNEGYIKRKSRKHSDGT